MTYSERLEALPLPQTSVIKWFVMFTEERTWGRVAPGHLPEFTAAEWEWYDNPEVQDKVSEAFRIMRQFTNEAGQWQRK